MSHLLVEIGCEELPYKTCLSLLRQLEGGDSEEEARERGGAMPGLVFSLFQEYRLLGDGEGAAPAAGDAGLREAVFREHLKVMVSPRRVAVLVADVPIRQTARVQRVRGPRVDVAFAADGVPTKAGEGFARGRGVRPSDLERETVDGTEFVVAVVEAERRDAREVLAELVPRLVTALQVPRGMRWGARPTEADDYLRFARPIRWLVCLYGDEPVRFPFYDIVAGDVSQGHRVLGKPVVIDRAEHYERHLREQRVIADHRSRWLAMTAGLDAAARAAGGRWSDPGDALAENVYLAEWPTVLRGSFDARHLRLPAAVLITAMQSHQRYFPVENEDGKLLPVFLFVSNGDAKHADLITKGNERVLEGRLDDAEFSYDRDLAQGLEAMAARLGEVVFHQKLGSLADKAARLQRLAVPLAEEAARAAGPGGEAPQGLERAALEAARLAKADLVSQMVQEFPTLQGVMGGIYARAAGLPDEVADAIAEHYLPLSATAPVPASPVGAVAAVCEKIDNIAGAWVAGEKPSGSRDPYGLRRAAMGIVRIALEHGLALAPRDLLGGALAAYEEQGVSATDPALVAAEAEAFVWERLQGLLLDEGLPFPLVEAALGAVWLGPDIPTVAKLARTFARVAREPYFNDVVVAYTRCASLAARADKPVGGDPDPELFREAVERELHGAARAAAKAVSVALARGEVEEALREGAMLRSTVDRYFDDVLVMDEDPALRANRLAQLAQITRLLGALGDFSRLPIQET